LFAAIGTTYGAGDGSTTFAIPDLRGRAVAGQDDMGGASADRLTNQSGGVDGDTLGASGGAETHTLTTPQIPAHTHTFQSDAPGKVSFAGLYEFLAENSPTARTSSSTGGGGAHNNVQPTLILNYIIKT
jgi:microcystin-dependent protein